MPGGKNVNGMAQKDGSQKALSYSDEEQSIILCTVDCVTVTLNVQTFCCGEKTRTFYLSHNVREIPLTYRTTLTTYPI